MNKCNLHDQRPKKKKKKKKKNPNEITKIKPIPIPFSLSVSLFHLSFRLWLGASPPPHPSELLLMITVELRWWSRWVIMVNDHCGWFVERWWCLPIGWWSRWSFVDCREEGQRGKWVRDRERWERGIDKANKILVFFIIIFLELSYGAILLLELHCSTIAIFFAIVGVCKYGCWACLVH